MTQGNITVEHNLNCDNHSNQGQLNMCSVVLTRRLHSTYFNVITQKEHSLHCYKQK